MTRLQIERIPRDDNGTYEDPAGEIVEVLKWNQRKGHIDAIVRICGTEQSDGEICGRDPEDCGYHN